MTVIRSAREIIAALPKRARDRLKRHVCWGCEISLDKGWCSGTGSPPCDRFTMLDRASRCLAESRLPEVRKAARELADEASR